MRGKLWIAWIVVLILSLLCLVVLHQHLIRQDNVTPLQLQVINTAIVTKSAVIDDKEKLSAVSQESGCRYAIVLQQSPVFPHQQLSRLHAIDQSWAQWIPLYPNTCLVAVLPCNTITSYNGNITSSMFRWIRPLVLSTSQCAVNDVNPYRNLAETFLRFLIEYPDVEVITLANDHSFFLVPNWYKFMTRSIPIEVLQRSMLYTGNHLALQSGMKDVSIQHFASGGGGIIMSRNIVEMMVLIWIVLSNDAYLQQVFKNEIISPTHPSAALPEEGRQLQHFDLRHCNTSTDITTVISSIITKHQHCVTPDKAYCPTSSEVAILLHGEQTVTIRYSGTSQYEVHLDSKIFSSNKFISMTALHSKCYAKDTWSRINPGIVMVHCLFDFFGLTFYDIQEQRDVNRNLVFQAPSLRLLSPDIVVQFSTSSCSSFGEIFNVYGFIRTVCREYDDWYIKAKYVLSLNVTDTCYSTAMSTDVYKYSFAKQLASLHYIDKVECRLLYSLLTTTHKITAQTLMQLWPQKGNEMGPYARKIASVEEANVLVDVLNAVKSALAKRLE